MHLLQLPILTSHFRAHFLKITNFWDRCRYFFTKFCPRVFLWSVISPWWMVNVCKHFVQITYQITFIINFLENQKDNNFSLSMHFKKKKKGNHCCQNKQLLVLDHTVNEETTAAGAFEALCTCSTEGALGFCFRHVFHVQLTYNSACFPLALPQSSVMKFHIPQTQTKWPAGAVPSSPSSEEQTLERTPYPQTLVSENTFYFKHLTHCP